MDDRLVDRRCRLTIANPVNTPNDFKNTTTEILEIDGGKTDDDLGMRVVFKITKSRKKEPNNSEITITNLAQSTRSNLQKKGVRVLLEAGYKDIGVNRYFFGDVRSIDHVRKDADWDTIMKLGDGERAWKYARVYESFAPGTPKASVLRTLAERMGLELGNIAQQAPSLVSGSFDQGWAAAGSAVRAFDKLVKGQGLEWSVQDGQVQLLEVGGHLELPIPEISPDSGLVESPEMGSPATKGKPALVKFKCLLTPVKPGGRVKLKSRRYNGYVTVQACEFEGDTHGGPWYTTISGVISE